MKHLIYTAIAAAAAALALPGCDSDADKLYVDGLEASTLVSSIDEVVLDADNPTLNAVTFIWTNDSKLKIYGTTSFGVADKSMPVYQLQMSLTDDFANAYTASVDGGFVSYTAQELNTIVIGLGAKPFVKTDVYVRINTALGTNDVDAILSDAQKLAVTCYKVDYTTASMLNEEKETIGTFYSPDTDGDGDPDSKGFYRGFFTASSWGNFWLRENDGTVWGNVGKDGQWGNASKDADAWNFWYPGIGGCYLLEIDVEKAMGMTATYIQNLTISGGVEAEMQYNRNGVFWIGVVTTTADNQTFTISGTTRQFDSATGTDSDAAIIAPITFGADGDSTLTVNGGKSFSIAKAGTYTVRLLLKDYSSLKYSITPGAEELDDPTPESIFIAGLNDDWRFYHEMKMTDEFNQIYTGVFGSDSCSWGYNFYTKSDGTGCYGGRKHSSGSLIEGYDDRILIPTPGVYIWNVNWPEKTYETTQVTSVAYAGLNDDWTLTEMTVDPMSPSRYIATVTITKASTYGCKIVLNGNWDTFMGGESGKLAYGRSFTDDQTLEPGTYTLTVDFFNETYSLRGDGDYPDALYIIGIDGKYTDNSWVTMPAVTDGVYSATVTITDDSAAEFEVYEDRAYTTKVGPVDSDGTVGIGSDVYKFWVTKPASGTYTFTINLVNKSWSITKAE